jgi:hypothetical protein
MHESFSDNFALVAIVFWIFIILITIVPIYLHHRRRLETEKTIRMAIEKGASLDPAMLERLLGANSEDPDKSTPEQSRRGGIITASVGIGIFMFSAFTGIKVLMGPAVLVLCIGIGLFVSAGYFKPDDKKDKA